MKKISICVPVYNEEENIEDMYVALSDTMNALKNYDYEILFADNASTDNSASILRGLAAKDKRVKVTINNRNFGPTRSGLNNLLKATGDAVIVIPCDFQEPVEMIPVFISEWEKGNLIVMGQKTKSEENKFMYFIRTIYYGVLRNMSTNNQFKHVTGFGLTDKSVIDQVRLYHDNYRGMKLYIAEFGYNVKLIPYTQQKRRKGKSSYNVSRYFDLAFSMIFQSSDTIFRSILKIGLGVSFVSFLSLIVYIIYALNRTVGVNLNTILLFLVLSLFGFVIISLSIVGEYAKMILKRVTKNPLVIEKESINFDEHEIK